MALSNRASPVERRVPVTSNLNAGEIVAIPTLPLAFKTIASVLLSFHTWYEASLDLYTYAFAAALVDTSCVKAALFTSQRI